MIKCSRVGDIDDIIGVAGNALPFGLQDSYHTEELIADADCLINGICSTGTEEILHYRLTDNGDSLARGLIGGAKP